MIGFRGLLSRGPNRLELSSLGFGCLNLLWNPLISSQILALIWWIPISSRIKAMWSGVLPSSSVKFTKMPFCLSKKPKASWFYVLAKGEHTQPPDGEESYPYCPWCWLEWAIFWGSLEWYQKLQLWKHYEWDGIEDSFSKDHLNLLWNTSQ